MSNDALIAATQSIDVIGCAAMEPTSYRMSSLENPRISLNDPDTYDLLTDGARTASGIRVSEENATTHPAVWQALNLIPVSIASLPLELFRLEPDGDRVKQESDPLYDLVHWKPNSEMDAFKFWSRMMTWRLLWNNAYAYLMRRGDGSVAEMIPLLPDRTSIERINGRLICLTETDGKLQPLPMDDVFHIEGMSIDNLVGHRFIKSARGAIGLALAELDFASRFYKNGGRVGGILELPSSMKKESRDKVEIGFQKTYGSAEAFRTVVLRENAKFHQAQVSPEQAQVVDARQESVRDIARFFNVRPGKLGEESRTSFASKSEDNRDYHDTTLHPHTCAITQQARDKLLTPAQKLAGYYFQHNTQSLLRMDLKSMAEALTSLRSGEFISSNEGRAMINMNKRPDGDNYRNPNINTTNEEGSDDAQASQAAGAFRTLLASTVRRMASLVSQRAKSKANKADRFIKWIDDQFDDQANSVSEAVGEVIQAAGDVMELDVDELTSSIVDEFMSESRQILKTVALSTCADDLKQVVDATMTEWATEAGERYANQLPKR